jgi:small subunit ribosomal protein S17
MTDVAATTDVVGRTRNRREARTGTVVSDRAEKTIRVRYDFIVRHPKYGKYYRRSTTLHAHDERNEAKVGDVVEVMACRPMSKMKRWRLIRIVRAAS